jgi:hypothetical protein
MRPGLSFKLSIILPLAFFAVIFSPAVKAQQESAPADSVAADTGGVSPLMAALEDFHQAMAPLWHESITEDDLVAIRKNAPVLNEKLLVLLRVQPPAGLQQNEEKLRDFLGKRQELAFQVTQVNLAAKGGPDSTLASAFEKMHWAYEELHRVFVEPLEGWTSFNETLYFLWHRALPEGNYQAIKETAPVLQAEADSLMKAPVPQSHKEQKDEFEERRMALKDAVYLLAEKCKAGTEQEIDQSLKVAHDRFEELNELLQ